MEIAVWGVLTGIWWLSSATVLLPFLIILKYNKFLRDLWFSHFFMRCMKGIFEPKLIPLRKRTFDLLQEHLAERDVSKPLQVLEIGIGSGANLEFYPENSLLTALDMNVNFGTYLRENQKKFPQVAFKELIASYAEDMKDVDDSSMDVVVTTYVLCSVTSVQAVLKEIKRVLKPGGKYVFMEHVSYPRSEWGFTVQKFAAPLWTIYCDGCCLLRDIGENIQNAGFSDVICHKLFPNFLIAIVRPMVYGIATK